jgi:CarD family transcriptional regulator
VFQVGDKVIDRNGRVYRVETKTNKDFGSGPVSYLVLAPCFSYDQSPEYRCFIPFSNQETLLHPIMSKKDCLDLIDSWNLLDTFDDQNARERKNHAQLIIQSGKRKDLCKAIKSLRIYKAEREKENKPFSDSDRKLLVSLQSVFNDEVSIVLGIPKNEVDSFIQNRVSGL